MSGLLEPPPAPKYMSVRAKITLSLIAVVIVIVAFAVFVTKALN